MNGRLAQLSSNASELRVSAEREELWSLAQLMKRLTWDEIRRCAVDDDEAQIMKIAIARVQCGLNDMGIAPR